MDLVLPVDEACCPSWFYQCKISRGREVKQLSVVTPRADDGADPGPRTRVVTMTLYYFLVVVTSPHPSSIWDSLSISN